MKTEFQDIINQLDEQNQTTAKETKDKQDLGAVVGSNDAVQKAIIATTKILIQFMADHKGTVSVDNHPEPIETVKTPDIDKVVIAVASLEKTIKQNHVTDKNTVQAIRDLSNLMEKLPQQIVIPETKIPDSVTVKNQVDYSKELSSLAESIKKIDVRPEIKVTPKVDVKTDSKDVIKAIESLKKSVEEKPVPISIPTDLSPLINSMAAVKSAVDNQQFPIPNYVLPFKDNQKRAVQVQLDASGNVPTIVGGGTVEIDPLFLETSYSTTSVQPVGLTNVSNYKQVSVHLVTVGTSATHAFQVSNDGTNWINLTLQQAASAISTIPATSATAASQIWTGSLNYKWFRLNVTGITAGTSAGVITFSSIPAPMLVNQISSQLYVSGTSLVGLQDNVDAIAVTATGNRLAVLNRNSVYNGTTWDRQRGDTSGTYAVGNIASGVADSGNPVKVGGKYNATSPTLTTGQRGDLQLDVLGNLKTIQENSLIQVEYDYVGVTYPTTTSEVYTYKAGGSGGTTVSTVTVVYTNTTKENISSVART